MIEVLHVDNHQLVVNKPTGLLTQPSGTEHDSLEAQAKAWIKEKYAKPGDVFLHALHRLDKPVSGIVLFARTSKALSRLNQAMRDKRTQKKYLAVVEGSLPENTGILEHYLIHGDYQAHVVTSSHPDASLARLHYAVLKQKEGCTLLEIVLETGRYHQIRAQLASIDCPIFGDTRYGSHHPYLPEAIALHHHVFTVPHPISEQLQTFTAPVPSTWPL